jgi:hypothetical protein
MFIGEKAALGVALAMTAVAAMAAMALAKLFMARSLIVSGGRLRGIPGGSARWFDVEEIGPTVFGDSEACHIPRRPPAEWAVGKFSGNFTRIAEPA